MKTAGMVLGIIGGSIAIIYSPFLIFSGTMFSGFSGFFGIFNPGIIFWFPGVLGLIAGGLGLSGGIILKKRNVMAGVFLIISAVLCIFAWFQIFSLILFVIAAVFAFANERRPVQYAQPYQPYIQPPQPTAQISQEQHDSDIKNE